MISNQVEYEANMDNWQDMREVMNQITSGSPVCDGNGWDREAQEVAEWEALDATVELRAYTIPPVEF